MENQIRAVVLAAGSSTRFNENKLLYPLGGIPLISHVLDLCRDMCREQQVISGVTVVTREGKIPGMLKTDYPEFDVVINPAPELGISGSIKCGVEHVMESSKAKDKDSDSIMFLLADSPFLTKGVLAGLIDKHQKRETGGITICSVKDGEFRNPAIFDCKYFDDLKNLQGDRGGIQIVKKVYKENPEFITTVNVDEGTLYDIDVKDDIRVIPDEIFVRNNTNTSYIQKIIQKYISDGTCISIVGAGGKTTVLYELATELSKMGKKVLITTTTHIEMPGQCFAESKEEVLGLWEEGKYAVTGQVLDSRHDSAPVFEKGKMKKKLEALPEKELEELMDIADVTLIEADGARHKLIKVPKENEPVVIERTDITIGIMGVSCIGRTIKNVGHRTELMCKYLGAKENDIITESMVEQIMEGPWGLAKNVRGKYLVIRNVP